MRSNSSRQFPVDHRLNCTSRFLGLVKDIGFPQPHDVPPRFRKLSGYLSVTRSISLDFGDPITRVMSTKQVPLKPHPVATVPKIPIAKDHDSCPAENYIRTAGQISVILAVSKSQSCKLTAKQNLMERILLPIRAL